MGEACVTLGWPLGDPWSPNPNPSRQRTATQKHKTQRNLRCALQPLPNTNYQLLNTCESAYITASVLLSHARSSSSAQVMSFAILCLTRVHVFGTWLGQLTEDHVLFRRKDRGPHRVLIPESFAESGVPDAVKRRGHKVRSANHGPNSARMNFLTPSRPVRRHHSLPPSRSIRMLTSKNGQQACSNGVNSASA
jgi:hypothetical protein